MRDRIYEIACDALFAARRGVRIACVWWLRLRRHRVVIPLDCELGRRILDTETSDWINLNHVTYIARRVTLRDEVMEWCRLEGIDPCLTGTSRERDTDALKLSIFFKTGDQAFAFKMRWL